MRLLNRGQQFSLPRLPALNLDWPEEPNGARLCWQFAHDHWSLLRCYKGIWECGHRWTNNNFLVPESEVLLRHIWLAERKEFTWYDKEVAARWRNLELRRPLPWWVDQNLTSFQQDDPDRLNTRRCQKLRLGPDRGHKNFWRVDIHIWVRETCLAEKTWCNSKCADNP